MAYKVKQVIVMRKDLNMRKGKLIAQGSHASMKVLLDKMTMTAVNSGVEISLYANKSDPLLAWLADGFAKICVYVTSEEELEKIFSLAKDAGIPCSMIVDAGHTEFHGVPTKTCIAIGPYWSEDIDKITGSLPLL